MATKTRTTEEPLGFTIGILREQQQHYFEELTLEEILSREAFEDLELNRIDDEPFDDFADLMDIAEIRYHQRRA